MFANWAERTVEGGFFFRNPNTRAGVFSGDDGADVFNNVGSIGNIVFTGGADDDLFTNSGTLSSLLYVRDSRNSLCPEYTINRSGSYSASSFISLATR